MSVVFGVLCGDGGAYLASDTMAFHSTGVYSGHCHKIVVMPSKRLAIATAGYLRTVNLLEVGKLGLERAFDDGGIEALVCELRRQVQADGYRPTEPAGPWSHDNCAIVGTPSALYEVSPAFSYVKKEAGHPAVYGSGMEVALGAWTACQQLTEMHSALLGMTMIERLRLVVSSVFEHCSTTGGRIEIWQPGHDLITPSAMPMTYKGALHAGS